MRRRWIHSFFDKLHGKRWHDKHPPSHRTLVADALFKKRSPVKASLRYYNTFAIDKDL